MTLEGFRIKHSTLIEHYQYIEMHLEGIYAALSGKGLIDGLQDVEKDAITRIINLIKSLDPNDAVLTEEDQTRLSAIVARRNYYVHDCYTKMVFDRHTDAPDNKYSRQLIDDIREANQMREYLFEKKMSLKIFGQK